MRNMKRLLLFIVPLLLTQPLFAQEQDPARAALMQQRRDQLKKKWEQQFRAADADNSGSLTREEAKKAGLPAAIMDRFDDIDSDHDGQLSPEELMAAYEKRLEAQKSGPETGE
jgi:Ca2+-binding EF-hand superfamily protein